MKCHHDKHPCPSCGRCFRLDYSPFDDITVENHYCKPDTNPGPHAHETPVVVHRGGKWPGRGDGG